MGIRLSQNDFKVEVLSTRAVALVSESALILYMKYGVLIDVNSSDVILKLLKSSMRCEDRRLNEICLHIKTELSFCIAQSSLEQ